MAKAVRLAKVAREINVGIDTIAAHLRKKGFAIDVKPTTKLTAEMHDLLLKDFRDQIALKERADKIQISFRAAKSKTEEGSANTTPPIKKTTPQKQAEAESPVTFSTNQPITLTPPVVVPKKEEKEPDTPIDISFITTNLTEQPTTNQPKEASIPQTQNEQPPHPITPVSDHTVVKEEVATPKEGTLVPSPEKVIAQAAPFLQEKDAKIEKVFTPPEEKKEQKKPATSAVSPADAQSKDQMSKVDESVAEKPVVSPTDLTATPKSEGDQNVKGSIVEAKQEVVSATLKKEGATVLEKEQPTEPVKSEKKVVATTSNSPEKEVKQPTSEEPKTASKPLQPVTPKKVTGTVVSEDKETSKEMPKKAIEKSTESKKDITLPPVTTTQEDSTTPKTKPESVPSSKDKDSSPVSKEVDSNTLELPKVVGKINLSGVNMKTRPDKRRDRKGSNPRNRDRDRNRKDSDRSRNDRSVKRDQRSDRSTSNSPKPTVKKDPKRIVLHKQQEQKNEVTPPPPVVKPPVVEEQTKMETVVPQLQGPKIIGKIELPVVGRSGKKKLDKDSADKNKRKRRRKRIVKPRDGATKEGGQGSNSTSGAKPGENKNSPANRTRRKLVTKRGTRRRGKKGKDLPTEVSEKEIQEKIRATMAKLTGGSKGKSSRAKLRRQKREQAADKRRLQEEVEENNILQVTEFISVSELAKLMETAVNNVITTCFNLGIIVSINQRLDAEVIELVTEEFGYEVEFISATEDGEEEEEIVDAPEDLKPRSPIVTIMGHVDHGKTSLLDYIRKANVVGGEMGGITQHIGAYEVATESGHSITFLDTPGHEAFTAMRARGAKVTDVAVIVVAADDSVMPQTKEAISHAQAAGVPMVFAINKIDKPDANPERIKEQLASMNILVEDWGGKYQSQEVSAKSGLNIDELLEKIALEAEILELKANPDRAAVGTVIEASLDKGRGYVTTVLVQAGTLKIGDIVLGGQYTGRVKAMFNERGKRVKTAGPSQPVLLLGLNGAPQAGDRVKAMDSEQEARNIAQRRKQLVREQQQRASKHITLEEIGRRLALGNFKELNLIVKGDVDGSVEALSDSLLKLSTEEIQVRIIHRAVGPIIGSDVLLASASDAIIIGFQVRPTLDARKQAESESIDIRMYSIIYDAIEEIKSAMEGMLEPTVEERFVCNVEVRNTFKVSKVGTIAGCYVLEGKVYPNTKMRLVRDGIVVYTGEIETLKRYKDDVKEVVPGQECGIAIQNFNDIKVGDIIEGYEEVKIKRTLADTRK